MFIVIGFLISYAGMTETDRPLGALVLGNALTNLGFEVYYVTNKFMAPLMNFLAGGEENVITSPVDEEQRLIKQTIAIGAIDSLKETQTLGVDGFSLEQNSGILEKFH